MQSLLTFSPLTQDLLRITGLKYYNDLVQPVPREEAIKIKDIVIEEVWLNEGNCKMFSTQTSDCSYSQNDMIDLL